MDWIITPTYNERNNIRVLVERIFALYPTIHVLVVDDNSPDGTGAVVKELQKKNPSLHLKQRAGKLGLASAYVEAFEEVLREHPDVRAIITMDADLSHDPTIIATMRTEITRHDLVVGSRYVPGGSIENWELWRRLLSLGGNWYTRLVTFVPIHDLTAGFVCYRASLLRRYDFATITAAGYGYQMQMKITAYRMGASITETPIVFRQRIEGESKISNRIIYEGLVVPWRFSPIASLWRRKSGSASVGVNTMYL